MNSNAGLSSGTKVRICMDIAMSPRQRPFILSFPHDLPLVRLALSLAGRFQAGCMLRNVLGCVPRTTYGAGRLSFRPRGARQHVFYRGISKRFRLHLGGLSRAAVSPCGSSCAMVASLTPDFRRTPRAWLPALLQSRVCLD